MASVNFNARSRHYAEKIVKLISRWCNLVLVWEESLDQGHNYRALLTELMKAFDCIINDLLTAKLQVYGFDNDSLIFIYNLFDRQ